MKKDLEFNGQRPGEVVLEVVKSHPYILYLPALKTILLLSIVVAIFLFVPALYMIAIIILIVAVIYLGRAIYCYNESIFIVTEERLFIVDQKGFFVRQITEIDLYKILDITSETKGFAKTILKFGDLLIRTAGAREDGGLKVKNVPDPYSVEQRIANLDGIHSHRRKKD